jgi:hypothetical protein
LPRRVMPGLGASGLGVSAAREREVRVRRRIEMRSLMAGKWIIGRKRGCGNGKKVFFEALDAEPSSQAADSGNIPLAHRD